MLVQALCVLHNLLIQFDDAWGLNDKEEIALADRVHAEVIPLNEVQQNEGYRIGPAEKNGAARKQDEIVKAM